MAHNFKDFPELTNNQMQFYYFESPHKQITEDFTAKVVKVTDGDTIRVSCNFRNFDFPVRLLDINAPERGTTEGEESKSWLREKIEGEDVEIRINPNNRVEKWGRLLGEIFFQGMSINEELIRERKAVIFGDKTFEQEMEDIWV